MKMKNKIHQLIEGSYEHRLKNSNYHVFSSIDVHIIDSLPEDVDLQYVFSFINKRIPPFILELIDVVYIGSFKDLEERHINAKYADGAIYVTNDQKNNQDMIDDIIHELAHAVEESYGQEIYSSGIVEQEFLGKRKRLERLLRYLNYDTHKYDFNNPEYKKKLDFFLFMDVGYDTIESLINGLFVSPYSATSLREYFAEGFEHYYLNKAQLVKKISPSLYDVLELLNGIEQ